VPSVSHPFFILGLAAAFACAATIGNATVALAQTAPETAPAATPAPAPRPVLPASVSDFLSGSWEGSGQFTRTGMAVSSTFRFSKVFGAEALSVDHAEIEPNSFAYVGVMSVDTLSGDIVLLLASNKGGGGRLMRSRGWIGETLAFEAAPELHAWFARERITFQKLGPDSFRTTYEMSRDAGATWRTGDVQTFQRKLEDVPAQ